MLLGKRYWGLTTQTLLTRRYFILAILYGLSTLIIPLATQYLVNSLALSGLVANAIVFLILLALFLTLSQILNYGQMILSEYIKREIFVAECRDWVTNVPTKKAHYMLEIQAVMKSYAMALSHLVELVPTIVFGFLLIMSFHPYFLLLPLIFGFAGWVISLNWQGAVSTSVKESDEKYSLVRRKFDGSDLVEEDLVAFLEARADHFRYIKRATLTVATLLITSQVFILGVGIYLIEKGELSIGQLVAAEIVLSGIMVSALKFPKTMEDLYDFETSKIKIEYALGSK